MGDRRDKGQVPQAALDQVLNRQPGVAFPVRQHGLNTGGVCNRGGILEREHQDPGDGERSDVSPGLTGAGSGQDAIALPPFQVGWVFTRGRLQEHQPVRGLFTDVPADPLEQAPAVLGAGVDESSDVAGLGLESRSCHTNELSIECKNP